MDTIGNHPKRTSDKKNDPMRQHIGTHGRILAALLPVSIALAIGGGTPADAAPTGSPWGATCFPSVQLVTENGQPVRFYDDLLKNKIGVVNTTYTHCEACLSKTAKLAQVQEFLGDRAGKVISIYSITPDPQRDSPAALKVYATQSHAGPGWRFLTGQQADIDLLRKKLGFYAARDTGDPFAHTPNLVIGNEATGQWMRHAPSEGPRYLATMIERLTAQPAEAQGGA